MPIKSGTPTSSAGDAPTTAPKTQSLLMTSLTSPQKVTTRPAGSATTTGGSTPESGGKFEVTQEYIQQTIQNALKKDNLSPGVFLFKILRELRKMQLKKSRQKNT